jgi:hypothetical protein
MERDCTIRNTASERESAFRKVELLFELAAFGRLTYASAGQVKKGPYFFRTLLRLLLAEAPSKSKRRSDATTAIGGIVRFLDARKIAGFVSRLESRRVVVKASSPGSSAECSH